MNIYDNTIEIKRQIDFAKKLFEFEKKILAICWGLQLIATASGGEVKNLILEHKLVLQLILN